MGKAETRLTDKMRKAGTKQYGTRLVIVKYHGNEYSRSGVSDLLCCLDGRFIACEVKAPESYGGSIERALDAGPTVLQIAFIGHVMEAGGTAAVVATVEQFLDVLAAADHINRTNCFWCAAVAEYGEGHCTLHPDNELGSV
jgi:hypothetical protein